MHIIHEYYNSRIRGSGDDNFILTNGIGGYASLSEQNSSKFQGVYFAEGFECYKAIENLVISGKSKALINRFTSAVKHKDDCAEYFFMPRNHNAFIYELSRKKEITLVLDCRKQLDFDDKGRRYNVGLRDGILYISYAKAKSGKKEYSIYIAMIPDSFDYRKTGKWEERNYSYDERRKGVSNGWVYNALKINASRIVFGFGTTEEKARENALAVKGMKTDSEYPSAELKFILDSKVSTAYLCAQQSLYKLITNAANEEGIFAGFYWFNHFWTRDELVSAGALISLKDFELTKKILMRNLKYIGDDGRLANRIPPTKTGNADSVGWLFKRFYDFLAVLDRKGIVKKYFSEREIRLVKAGAEKAVRSIIQNHSDSGILIKSSLQETWMDTRQAGRDGYRLEIQALQLAIYRFLAMISVMTNDFTSLKYAEHKEAELKKKTREVFWNGHYLADGSDDSTIRPNVFLVHYIYPELLSKKEWIRCFDNVLPRLFTGFGLSSIDMHNPRFQPHHTGENDESYQNGDSWYWVNNLAAICLYRTAKFRYAKYIQKLLWGSTNDILWQGIPGAASEISSAKRHEAFGALCQAWSNSTYIEMIRELF